METKTVSVHEAQSNLAALVTLVQQGADVIIAENGTPLVRMVPMQSSPTRVAGLHQGTAWISDDFDAPLPDEFWEGKG